jgi:hypothetical protein
MTPTSRLLDKQLCNIFRLGSLLLCAATLLGCVARLDPNSQRQAETAVTDGDTTTWLWDDKATPQAVQEQSLPLYLDFYERYRNKPDGSFEVPEFRNQARRILDLLDRFERDLEQKQFPLKVVVDRDSTQTSNLKKHAAELKSLLTWECFRTVAQRPRELLSTNRLRYDHFWASFRLAALAMTRPCDARFDASGLVSLQSFPMERDTRPFLPFPAVLLPAVQTESTIEQFNALFELPLYLVGIIDAVAVVDDFVVDPFEFVRHDLAHAQDSFRSARKKGALGRHLSQDNWPALTQDLAKLSETFDSGLRWEQKEWSTFANSSPTFVQLKPWLTWRHDVSTCVNDTIGQETDGQEQQRLHLLLFQLHHEMPRELIPDLNSKGPPLKILTIPEPKLKKIFDGCQSQHPQP